MRQADVEQSHDRNRGISAGAVGVDLYESIAVFQGEAEDAVAERIGTAVFGIVEDVAEVEPLAKSVMVSPLSARRVYS